MSYNPRDPRATPDADASRDAVHGRAGRNIENQSNYSIRNGLFMKTKRSSVANSSRLGMHRDSESPAKNADLTNVVSPSNA